MISLFTSNPKAWVIKTLMAGMSAFVTSSVADAKDVGSLVDRDAVMVSLDDDFDEGVSQVGFFDLGDHNSSHVTSCDGCGESVKQCCCTPWWAHRTGAFGQFLLLRPGNTDQIYTIEQNTTTPGAFPTGPIGRVNIDEEGAYRVGFSIGASECTSLVASFTRFEGNTSDTIVRSGANVLNSQIIHPSTLTVGASSLQSSADYSLDFDLIDVAYRHLWKQSDIYAINWLAGFRYGSMEQDFRAQQEVSVATGLVSVETDVDFYGFGMMFGVDAERRSPCTGLMVYGKALSSFLGGDWRGDYVQVNQFGGGVVANDYEDYRVTPVLELELGFGWQSKCGRYRASAGYLTSAWYDAISNRQYVDAVRNNNYTSVDETITFSGLTTTVEARF